MQYRICGKTNEKVSVLGFGCMRLPLLAGGNPADIDEEKALPLVRKAIDSGVNYIDTAYPYHGTGMAQPGASEPFVGKLLRDGYREKVHLATKLPSWLVQTRGDMDKLLAEQLARLETDHIDFYLVHSLSIGLWNKLKSLGILEFLDAAKADGRIKHAGFSFHDKGEHFAEIVDCYDWGFCQIQYNYMDEDYQAGLAGLEYAAAKGLGIIIMEPLRGGKLAGTLPDEVVEVFAKLGSSLTPAQLALKWVYNHPAVSLALSGMNTLQQLEENLAVSDIATPNAMTPQELATIDAARRGFLARTKIDCTACGYCMPCPCGVNIPTCIKYYNHFYMFGSKESYYFMPDNQKASACTGCGQCAEHCPQGINIPQEMQNIVALFARP